MTPQEENWFKKLTEEHRTDAKTFAKPNYKKLWDRLVDMYKESAHFVYELIQNADDAHATEAHFELHNDKLIFKHNGLKKFSISNPETEEDDRNNGKLGDLNSITSIAFSTKNDTDESGNSIGKFGIGFKSVYTYTNRPEIYDKTMCFRIEQKIIPVPLNKYYDNWKEDETWFVIPFNNPAKNPEKAVSEILHQLSELSNPTLFLNNLERVSYQYEDGPQPTKGHYLKKIKQSKEYPDGTKAEQVSITHEVNGDVTEEQLWIFSRKKGNKLTYSVGFGLEDNKLVPRSDYAYCYFQTKEETHLNFIIHAPFLLTPDRQHIKNGEEHNVVFISHLADLAADSIVHLRDIGIETEHPLIDDNIIKIIPIKSSDFFVQKRVYSWLKRTYEIINESPKSLEPFYTRVLNKFKSEELLPSKDGFSKAAKAFWAEDTDLVNLFSDADLSKIEKIDDAKWTFRSLRRAAVSDERREWIEKVIGSEHSLNENHFLQNVTADFCKRKFYDSFDWIISFYEWLGSAKERSNIAKTSPFFIDENGDGVCIYNNGTLDLFFPTGEKNDYHTVNNKLYENISIKEFLKNLGVKHPSFKDEIYSKILPRYANGMPDEDTIKSDFRKILNYYRECPNSEMDSFFEQLKENLLIHCHSTNEGPLAQKAGEIYFENDELKTWFKDNPDTKFLDFGFYAEFVDVSTLNTFFERIGIATIPRIIQKTLCNSEMNKWNYKYADLAKNWVVSIDQKQIVPSSTYVTFDFYSLDGLDNILVNIKEKESCLLWKYLARSLEAIDSYAIINYRYRSDTPRRKNLKDFIIPLTFKLYSEQWIYTKDGAALKPGEIYLDNISDIYDTQSFEAKKLIEFFHIKEKPAIDESKLPEEIRSKLAAFERLKQAGIDDLTDEEIEQIKRNREKVHSEQQSESEDTQSSGNTHEKGTPKEKLSRDIFNRAHELEGKEPLEDDKDANDNDSDEWTPPSFNSKKQIEKAKEKLAVELNRIEELEKAKELATNASIYTYQWFKSMLQLEILRSNENNQNSKELHISFGKVEIDSSAQKTLILSQPNKKIPAFIEELYGINLIVHFRGVSPDKQITFEAASIRSFTLRLKMMRNEDVSGLNVNDIASAEIIAKSPVFLLQELQKQFDTLQLDSSTNLKDSLCDNIRFVFGPPGTGKTTFLAEKVLLPWAKENEACKVLVLAPTNKAADVLTKRIMEKTNRYSDFLLRFGTTGDEFIENSGVFCNRNFDISKRNQNIVVTTIARLPYDSFVKEGKESLFIRDIKWDYIVVDEASMIPLIQMVYLLYSQKPREFVIAGDPFQIEPTVAEESWKKENIYEMVGLKNFASPHTVPYSYEVERLETQYRSIPSVGEIYSKLTYDGILQHNRTESDRKTLEIEGLDIGALNIVKFPVSRYESIYRSKRLGQGSNYQIYSALFTYEFTCHLVNSIQKTYAGKKYSIGIISPYKAEADLIGNLLRAKKFTQDISVLSGTVHSFQGDECDIMLTVFNTPENISSSEKMFLNHKNIINVAISRARDYLFVLMPDEDTKGVDNLNLINQLEKYMKEGGICKQFHSRDLEKWMFGNEKFLEENAFSTGHQSVNVYGEPEKRYEIRSEDDAIDIQVHLS